MVKEKRRWQCNQEHIMMMIQLYLKVALLFAKEHIRDSSTPVNRGSRAECR